MLFNSLTSLFWLLLLRSPLMAAPKKGDGATVYEELSSRQKEYYHKRWKQRMRFVTTPRPGETAEPDELRKVYPCFCYKPPQHGEVTTEAYEKYMIETKDIFILNK